MIRPRSWSTAISQFDTAYVQNEKNTGRYRMLTGAGRLAGRRGVRRSAEDRRRGSVIEALLCLGEAHIDADLAGAAAARLVTFAQRKLIRWDGDRLILERGGEPYARSIAAVFDAYRGGEHRFSSAV